MASAPTPGSTGLSTEAGSMFEVVEEDVDGVRLRVFKNAPPSLRAIWQLSAIHGDAPYLVFDDEKYSYTEAHAIATAIACRLVDDLGVCKGDRVAIAMRNYPEWAFAFWAASSIGAVIVPLNAWWTGPELEYGLAHSGAVVLFADDERLDRIRPRLGETSVQTVIAVRTDAHEGELAFADFATPIPGATLPDVEVGPDDDATIMYTSGTTGRPKGAVGTNRNIGGHIMNATYAAMAAAAAAPAPSPGAAPPALITLLTFPLFHVGGLHSFLLPYTVGGGKIVLTYKWDAVQAVDLIEREGVTSVAGVPTTMFQVLDEAARQGRELPSIAGVASGATLVPPKLVKQIDAQLSGRAAPANGYGLTETSGAAIGNSGRDYLDRPTSVGRPISPVMEVRIAAPDGEAVPTGEVGEIWLRGPTVIRGYFENPDATAAAITDGWFHTGDAGSLDEEGFLYVADRIKDMVIRGGENIYAAEVEAALYEHPDVIEAAIVGVPDERYGEQVAAVVRRRDGSTLDVATLQEHVRERLAAFKVPTIVQFTETELPRNAAGKVLKRELRESLAKEA
ncbi:MAG: AMP-binding protein [Acidimicrobiia bacterium]